MLSVILGVVVLTVLGFHPNPLWRKTTCQGLGYELWTPVRTKVNYSVEASNPRLWPQECHAWSNWANLVTDTLGKHFKTKWSCRLASIWPSGGRVGVGIHFISVFWFYLWVHQFIPENLLHFLFPSSSFVFVLTCSQISKTFTKS